MFLLQVGYSQQIPNSDFEDWENINSAVGWTCGIEVNNFTLNTATRSSDAYSGNYCIKMKTKALFTGDVVPGMAQLGKLDIDELEPYGGIPYTAKPTALQIKAKYNQQGGDSMIVACYLSKYKDNKVVIVGGAWYVYAEGDIPNYKTITIPIYYLEEELTPDTINIFFSSSYKQPHEESTLYVDDLKILFGEYLLEPTANKPPKVSDTEFTAEWLGADYTSSYILDVASDKDFNNKIIDNLDVGDTNQFDVAIPNPSIKKIFYRVKARYDESITAYSNVMEFPVPHAPKCYEAQNVTPTSFYANWENLDLKDYYILSVALDSNFKQPLEGFSYLVVDTNRYIINKLKPETDYYYNVRARYIISETSKNSNVIKVTTPKADKNDDLRITAFGKKIRFDVDTSYIDAELKVYNAYGKMYYENIIKDVYVEVPAYSSELFIIYIKKADGEIVKRKIGIIPQ